MAILDLKSIRKEYRFLPVTENIPNPASVIAGLRNDPLQWSDPADHHHAR
jgi:hypothetical protein